MAVADSESASSAADDVISASEVVEADAAEVAVQVASIDENTVVVDGSSSVQVTLPVSESAEATVNEGLVELSDDDSSSIVPVVMDDGSVAIHSVLKDSSAPTTYAYVLDLPEGATLELSPETGAVTAFSTDGAPVLYVAEPWATDANGESVPTHYSVDGHTLTQHVDVSSATAFPVVADPWLGIDLVASLSWTSVSGSGWKLNVNPTAWARSRTGDPAWIVIGTAGYNEAYNKAAASTRSRFTVSGEQQYQCHVGFAGIDAQWNMEMWKPRKDLVTQWIGSSCN